MLPGSSGFPGGANVKESAGQFRRQKEHRFISWVGKIPWRWMGQPTSVFPCGGSHGQRAWLATVHRVTKNWTRLWDWTTGIHTAGMKKLRWLNTDSLPWKEPLIHSYFWTLALTSENSLFIPLLGHIWTGERRPSIPWGVYNDPFLS